MLILLCSKDINLLVLHLRLDGEALYLYILGSFMEHQILLELNQTLAFRMKGCWRGVIINIYLYYFLKCDNLIWRSKKSTWLASFVFTLDFRCLKLSFHLTLLTCDTQYIWHVSSTLQVSHFPQCIYLYLRICVDFQVKYHHNHRNNGSHCSQNHVHFYVNVDFWCKLREMCNIH